MTEPELLVEVNGSVGNITLTPVSRFVSLPGVEPNPGYRKRRFIIKLHEMGFDEGVDVELLHRDGE